MWSLTHFLKYNERSRVHHVVTLEAIYPLTKRCLIVQGYVYFLHQYKEQTHYRKNGNATEHLQRGHTMKQHYPVK